MSVGGHQPVTHPVTFSLFVHSFNGTVSHKYSHALDPNSIVARPAFDPGYVEGPRTGIILQKPEHAELLRRRTAHHYNLTMEGCQAGKDYPVIRILNRLPSSNRTLLNVDKLQRQVSKMTDKHVNITYFEDTEFLEQVSVMMNTDILISPHGAQLTSLNFMPTCGGVFEAFAPGYWFPHFFGPLAASSGLGHGYVYTGYDLEQEWFKGGLKHRPSRHKARVRDICVPLETSLSVIGQLVDNWKSCCHHLLKRDE